MRETEEGRLRETAREERPQERLLRLGSASLSDAELTALILRNGTQGHDVLALSHRLLRESGGLSRLSQWKASDFMAIHGIGPAKAVQLASAMELARRLALQSQGQDPLFDRPEKVADYLRPLAEGLEVEKFWVLCLNRKNRLLRRVEVTSGTATSSLAHPREVFRPAIRDGAVSLICAHNHPSGDPTPSAADIQVTRQLREAGRTLDVSLTDHVIVGRPGHDPSGRGFYSFREAGLL